MDVEKVEARPEAGGGKVGNRRWSEVLQVRTKGSVKLQTLKVKNEMEGRLETKTTWQKAIV